MTEIRQALEEARQEGVRIGLEAAASTIQAIVDHAPDGSLGRELRPVAALLRCLDAAACLKAKEQADG